MPPHPAHPWARSSKKHPTPSIPSTPSTSSTSSDTFGALPRQRTRWPIFDNASTPVYSEENWLDHRAIRPNLGRRARRLRHKSERRATLMTLSAPVDDKTVAATSASVEVVYRGIFQKTLASRICRGIVLASRLEGKVGTAFARYGDSPERNGVPAKNFAVVAAYQNE